MAVFYEGRALHVLWSYSAGSGDATTCESPELCGLGFENGARSFEANVDPSQPFGISFNVLMTVSTSTSTSMVSTCLSAL